MDFQKEILKRKTEFTSRLSLTGNSELASLYHDIITLENALEVLQRPATETPMTNSPTLSVIESVRRGVAARNGNSGFNLRDAVREQIKEYGQQSFTTRKIFEALKAKHPDEVTDARMPSVSATLANLFTKKEVSKTKDGLGKTKFRSLL